MKRVSLLLLVPASLLVIVSCAATATSDSASMTTPPPASEPVAAPATPQAVPAPAASPAPANQEVRRGGQNLQVLPQDIPRPELIALMRSFTRSLGVKCDHCHASDGEELNFSDDSKEEKQIARVMMRMTQSINNDHLSKVSPRTANNRVTCYTCHLGSTKPAGALPPPPPKPAS